MTAMIVKVERPCVVGVPVIAPLASSRTSPAGSAPAVTLKLVGPLALTANAYGIPTTAVGGVSDEMTRSAVVIGVLPGVQFAGTVIEFDWSVTAALIASRRPMTLAPVAAVIDWAAMMVPWNCALVPMLAELPICQNTLQALAPPVMMICVAEPMVRLLAAWKTQMESAVPARVSDPLFEIDSAPPE